MKRNEPVTQTERTYPDHYNLISTTDLKGRITYANRDFCEVSGFELEELEGKPHNVVRHPDMPSPVFGDLWSRLKRGDFWMGIVKNRCKNGDHYWVDAFVTPIFNGSTVLEYQSVRSKPDPERVRRAQETYRQLNQGKIPWRRRGLRLNLHTRLLGGALLAMLPLLIQSFLQGGPAATIASAVLSGGLLALVVTLSLRPLGLLLSQARELIQDPAMQWVYTGRTDEFGELQLALKIQQSQLRAVVGRVLDASQQADSVARQSAAQANHACENSETQLQRTEQAAQAMNEVANLMQDMARNADQAAEAARNTRTVSQQGNQVLEQAMTAIRRLATQLNQAAAQIRELRNQGDQIVAVVNVIGDIAEQTNLLALNAAIEAARAGEQGRGFAVVAEEVRALASRTQASTHEIQAMVQAIQQGTQQAVALMTEGERQSDLCVRQGEVAMAAFQEIDQRITSITSMNQQTAATMDAQSEVISSVCSKLNQVCDIARSNADLVRNCSRLSHEIEDRLSQQLNLIRQFLLPARASARSGAGSAS